MRCSKRLLQTIILPSGGFLWGSYDRRNLGDPQFCEERLRGNGALGRCVAYLALLGAFLFPVVASALDQIVIERTSYFSKIGGWSDVHLGYTYFVHHAPGSGRRWKIVESDVVYSSNLRLFPKFQSTPNGVGCPFEDTTEILFQDFSRPFSYISTSCVASIYGGANDPPTRVQYRRRLTLYEYVGNSQTLTEPIDQVELIYNLTLVPTNTNTGATQEPVIEDVPVNFFTPGTQPAERPGMSPARCLTCAQADGCTLAGAAQARTNSALYEISLGPSSHGASTAGFLALKVTKPHLSMYEPSSLGVPVGDPDDFRRISDLASRPGLLQYSSPTAVFSVVDPDTTDHAFQLLGYHRDQATARADGSFDFVGDPFVTFTIENPDASRVTTNKLRITRVFAGRTEIDLFTYTSSTDVWALESNHAGTTETFDRDHTPITNFYTETRTTRTTDGAIKTATAKTTQVFPFGAEPIREVLDPGGKALTSTWEYYSSEATDSVANYRQVKTHRNPWRGWTKYTYGIIPNTGAPDPFKTVSQFLDAPESSADSAVRVVTRTYLTGTPSAFSYLDSESLLGQEVRRVFHIVRPGLGHDEVVALTPGAAWTDGANTLTTQYRYIFGGEFDGELASVSYPDGTRTNARYEIDPATSTKTTVMERGVPDPADPSILTQGLRTTTLTNPAGEILAETTVDIASGLTVSSRVAATQDSFGRPLRTDTLTGSEWSAYSCCGLASFTDPSGLTTTFTQDGGTRTETRQGITFTSSQSGGTTSVFRQGGADPAQRIALSQRNLAGQLVRSVDAGNRETSFDETIDSATAFRTRITTRPDGGTITETFYPDGQLQSVSGTATFPRRYEYGVTANQRYRKEIRLGENGEDLDSTQTFFDMAGRVAKVVRSHESGVPSVSTLHYNSKGQLIRSVDSDGVVALFEYNALGEQTASAIDLNRNGNIDRNGTDPVVETEFFWTTREGKPVRRSVERVCQTDGSPVATELRLTDAAADGLESWATVAGLVTHSKTVLAGNGDASTTLTYPDGSKEVSTIVGGRVSQISRLDRLGGSVHGMTYVYDSLGRIQTSTDSRNGATTYSWFGDDQLSSLTTPGPQTTAFTYDAAGRPATTTLPDGGVVNQVWYPSGRLQTQTGARVYPVEYTYDSQGRLKTLSTAGGLTRWLYHPESGRLLQKRHADGFGPVYAYTPAGRLASRVTGRGINTTYGYDPAGGLASIHYSDDTPDLSYTRDRQGRLSSAAMDGSTAHYDYTLSGALESETVAGGLLNGITVHREYDALFRRDRLAVSGPGWSIEQSYAYDDAGRLGSITSGEQTFTYAYEPESALVASLTSATGGNAMLTSTRSWDLLGRLTSVANVGASFNRTHAYRYNLANQRDLITREDGSQRAFAYDSLGQVTSAAAQLANGDPMDGHGFGYTYDAIGNRTASSFGLAGSRTLTYSPASGDGTQYSAVNHPGVALITGEADPAAAVTVSGAPASSRQSGRFAHELTLDHAAGPAAQSVTVAATLGGVTELETRETFVPAAIASPEYDLEGNLTFDGFLEYTWDAENRLKSLRTRTGLSPPGSALRNFRQTFTYDPGGRRTRRQTWFTIGGKEYPAADELLVYDGWNQVAVLDADTKRPRQTCTWGLDTSGTLQGAGGVGGLLLLKDIPSGTAHLPAYDGNGNITALLHATTGAVTASYDYDPFGNPLSAAGPFAEANPWRFSTKPRDPTTGLYDYGYRTYDPTVGRWLSRDPLGEAGGVNLYAFVGNRGDGWIDVLGREAERSWGWHFANFVTLGNLNYIENKPDLGQLVDSGDTDGIIAAEYERSARVGLMTEAIETGTDTYDLLTFGASVAGGWKLGGWLLKPGRRAGQADRLRRLLNNSDRWLALRSKCPPPLPIDAAGVRPFPGIGEGGAERMGFDWVAKINKGERPHPSSYMSVAERNLHASLFEAGAVRIQPAPPQGVIGRTETWVFPRIVVDDLIQQADGEVAKLEVLLGFDAGYLGASPVMVEIPAPRRTRIPDGNEFGANPLWRAGGLTSGGVPEAVIDPVPPSSYTVRPVF